MKFLIFIITVVMAIIWFWLGAPLFFGHQSSADYVRGVGLSINSIMLVILSLNEMLK